jgi:UDP-N-acetylglucosamine--N-acetylmuramyl-(pentapeptide) pyrophosphoryl-undecaprenol N-acetylglucosamine transferase
MNGSGEQSSRIVIAAGGTGGHIFPALAVWEALSGRHPELELVWMGSTHRMESRLIPARGIEFIGLRQTEIRRRPSLGNILYNLRSLWFLGTSFFRCVGEIRRIRPVLVLTTGGFASGAAGLAARMTRTPLGIIEPNAYPGLTNRFLGKGAAFVCVAYAQAKAHFPRGAPHLLGVPARGEVARKDRDQARRELGLGQGTLMVLAMGGSQGAAGINRLLPEAAKLTLKDRPDIDVRFVHQCGAGKKDTVKVSRETLPENRYEIAEFIEDVPTYLAAADVVVSRAGASTLAEIACRGLPAILVPYPHAAENHQVRNARSWEEAGAAVCIEEKDLTPSGIATSLLLLLTDAGRREAMGEAARGFGDPDAAERIADLVEPYLAG